MNNIKEMIAVVQMYIHHRKDVEVKIKLRDLRDVALLTEAYQIASEWLNNNGFKIINNHSK